MGSRRADRNESGMARCVSGGMEVESGGNCVCDQVGLEV